MAFNYTSYSPWASYGLYSAFAPLGSVFDALSSPKKKTAAQKYEETQKRLESYKTTEKEKPKESTPDTSDSSKGTSGSRETGKYNAPDMRAGTVGYDANTARDVMGALAGAAKGAAIGGATNLGAGLALGLGASAIPMGLAGAINPASVAGLASNALAASQGVPTSTTATAVGGMLGTALAGPVGGLIGGFAAPFAADALSDLTNSRPLESIRDPLEDTYGYFGGRKIGRGFEVGLDNPLSSPVESLTGAIANRMGIDYAADITGYMSDLGLSKKSSLGTLKDMGWASSYADSMRSLDKAMGMDTSSRGQGGGIRGGFADTGEFGGIGTDKGGWGTGVGGDIGGGMLSHGDLSTSKGGWSSGFGDSSPDDSDGSSMGSSSGGGDSDYGSDDGW